MSEQHNNTGKRNAVGLNSRQEVDNSSLVLRRPTLPATAGRTPEASPSDPRIPQHKSWAGGEADCKVFGGEAAVARAAGATSVHETEINRKFPDNPWKSSRKHGCGAWTIAGVCRKTLRRVYKRLPCKTWHCGFCGPRKAKRYRYAISLIAEREQLNKFLTLTLDPKKITGNPVRYLRKAFDKFRVYLRKYAKEQGLTIKYICVLEFQKNGNPHLHILLNCCLPHEWISSSWSAVGGGFIWITRVDVHRVSRYLSKYLTKELLLSAPLRSRRVTTSRSIHINEKQQTETTWELLRYCISKVYLNVVRSRTSRVLHIQLDEEGFLDLFSTEE